MFQAEVSFQPGEMLASWRNETGRLFVTTPTPPRLGERAAVRIRLAGGPVAATVLGKVVSVHRAGAHSRVELAPESESLPALRIVLSAARGDPVSFTERQLRWLARLPVMVSHDAGTVYMNTYSVAEGGCGLTWSGPLPAVGQMVRLRFSAPRGPEVDGVVRWASGGGAGNNVGVEFTPGAGPYGWSGFLAGLARSGAPRA